MIQKLKSYLPIVAMMAVLFTSACKKDDDNSNNGGGGGNGSGNAEYVLLIENGAQSINLGSSATYSAVLVNSQGQVTPATGVTWTTSDQEVATINATGAITTKGTGAITVTASVTVGGVNYSTTVPLGIAPPSVFAVAPSAIIWGVNDGPLQLETIYFGTSTTKYSFASSNSNIASVSSTGLVTFNAVGSCQITVTAVDLTGSPEIIVPVMVVGAPAIPLPIVKIKVTPAGHDMFRGETKQFAAKAYNANNEEVSTTFTWEVSDNTIGTISNTGLFTANKIGKTTIQVTAQGISGQAEVVVNPDTLIIVEPMYVSVPAGGNQQFTAKTYKVNRTTGDLSQISNPAGLKWEMPSYGISIFDVGTVDNTGKVTIKTDAIQGLQAFVIAYVEGVETIEPGVGIVSVGVAEACNCGADNPNVASISVNTTNIELGFGEQAQIGGQALNSANQPVANAAIVYCSDNDMVAAVDSEGNVSAMGAGTAKITVCVGSKKATVNVKVTF